MAGISAEGFQGMDELKANLEKLYGKLSGDSMRNALYAGAEVYKEAITANTPVGQAQYVCIVDRSADGFCRKLLARQGLPRHCSRLFLQTAFSVTFRVRAQLHRYSVGLR